MFRALNWSRHGPAVSVSVNLMYSHHSFDSHEVERIPDFFSFCFFFLLVPYHVDTVGSGCVRSSGGCWGSINRWASSMSPALWKELLCSCEGSSVCSEGEKALCCFSLMSWDWCSLVVLCDHLLCLSWRWTRRHGWVFQILPASNEQRARTLLPLGIKWVSSHGVVNLNPAEHFLVPEWKEWQGRPSVSCPHGW